MTDLVCNAHYVPEYCFELINNGKSRGWRLDSPLWIRQDQEVWLTVTPRLIKNKENNAWLYLSVSLLGEYGYRWSGYRLDGGDVWQ